MCRTCLVQLLMPPEGEWKRTTSFLCKNTLGRKQGGQWIGSQGFSVSRTELLTCGEGQGFYFKPMHGRYARECTAVEGLGLR